MRTKQEVFDYVANHLRKQGRRAMMNKNYGSSCAYRGANETMCAVGCLIPDEVYTPNMEHKNLTILIEDFRDVLPKEIIKYRTMLRQLQVIHDAWTTGDVEILNNALRGSADQHDVTYTE